MGSAALLDSLARRLATDAAFLEFKNLQVDSSDDDKMAYIVKEEEPDVPVDADTAPMCLIYTRPGRPDARTSTVYVNKVVFDCYASDSNTARMMCDRIEELLQNWQPDGAASFVCIFAADTSFKTGITGVKAHRIFYDISQYKG